MRERLFSIACLVLALVALATAASAVTLDGIEPSSAAPGTRLVAVVTGTGFVPGAHLALSRDQTWIPAARNLVEGPTTLVCVLAVPSDAPRGSYTLNLVNGGIGPAVVYQKPDAFTVAALPPGGIGFTADPPCGPAPLAVRFRVLPSLSTAAAPVSYAWEFGDGATATGPDPVHTYTAAGRYAVTLAAADAGGRTLGKATGWVLVTAGTPPVGGETAYFLVDTTPRGAAVYLEEISGTRTLAGSTENGPLNVTVYLTATPVKRIVANLSGYVDAVHEVRQYPPPGQTVRVGLTLLPVGTPPPGPKALIGSWRLVSFLGAADALVPAAPRPVPFVTFSPDGRFSGSVGCNHFGGTYTATDSEITFGPIVSTEMYCTDPAAAMDQETRVLGLFPLTVGYRVDEPVLTLLDRAGRPIMTFERILSVRPTDPDGDGRYEDMNGNGRRDFADVVLYFERLLAIRTDEAVALFDYNGNGRIDFADVVWLFNRL